MKLIQVNLAFYRFRKTWTLNCHVVLRWSSTSGARAHHHHLQLYLIFVLLPWSQGLFKQTVESKSKLQIFSNWSYPRPAMANTCPRNYQTKNNYRPRQHLLFIYFDLHSLVAYCCTMHSKIGCSSFKGPIWTYT